MDFTKTVTRISFTSLTILIVFNSFGPPNKVFNTFQKTNHNLITFNKSHKIILIIHLNK